MTNKGYLYTGVPTAEELADFPGKPSEARMRKGRVAVVECLQNIPCNPCEAACAVGAITVGENITALPCLDDEKCTGCGKCVAQCPGLAIFIVNKAYSETEATVDFPFEYLPLPEKDAVIDAVDRAGAVVCKGRIVRVTNIPANAGTSVVSVAVPLEYADVVRSIKRL